MRRRCSALRRRCAPRIPEEDIVPNHIDYVRQHCDYPVRAIARSFGLAVAVTDTELVIGRAGLFGRWGASLERFPLEALHGIEVAPNPSADLLRVHFADRERPLLIMYSVEDKAQFDAIISTLRARVGGSAAGPNGHAGR
jgi:hypothetical protein